MMADTSLTIGISMSDPSMLQSIKICYKGPDSRSYIYLLRTGAQGF